MNKVLSRRCKYKIILITGVDGSGKTLVSERLSNILSSGGHKVVRVWSRFNNYVSKPILALARIMGLNYYEVIDGVKIGYHDFEKSRLISCIFVICQLIDVWIASFIKFWMPLIFRKNVVIIADRGPYDTLIDVSIDTKKYNLPETFLGKLYIKCLPSSHVAVLLIRDRQKIEECRPDVKADRKFEARLGLYMAHARALNFKCVDNNGDLESTLSKLSEAIQYEA